MEPNYGQSLFLEAFCKHVCFLCKSRHTISITLLCNNSDAVRCESEEDISLDRRFLLVRGEMTCKGMHARHFGLWKRKHIPSDRWKTVLGLGVIACFDDTGLDAARCLTDKPVIGIGEAAYRCAAMVSNKFSVVTTLARSVPALEHNLARYGMAHQCVKVRSSEVAVLDLEDNNPAACRKIEAEIEAAIADDKAEAIVLGCAGMADLADSLSQRYQLPVLDGLACAVALAESLVRLKLRTSRLGGYASPPAHKLQLAFGSDPVAA